MSFHVTASRPALVVRHLVSEGEVVRRGQALVVTETMKLEEVVNAPGDGVVASLIEEGQMVDIADLLVLIEPESARQDPPRRAPVSIGDVLAAATRHGGTFVELGLLGDDPQDGPDGERLAPVAPGGNTVGCGVLAGVIRHRGSSPDGSDLRRVLLVGDPSRSMGAVSEPECRVVLAAIDLAEAEGVPLEWVAVSAGAVISLHSGTENMDWCAAVVARLVRFTQAGGEVIVVTAGPNVGAQSYWNAEATMLGHCAGMLVMVEGSSMVLTGRRALGLAGGATEATDEMLGGYDEVMGPNGEAHHRVGSLDDAFDLVLTHHRVTRAALSLDDVERSVCEEPYRGVGPATTVGEVLEVASNPTRKVAFSIRPVMSALVDRDSERLERWKDHTGAEGAVVWDSRVGGEPVTLVGIESHHRDELGPEVPRGGWSGATLYPGSSKKISRAINSASGRRAVVVLANLAGFDGSRWSLQRNQLEWGAEIARAVVNFRGPIVVVVIGRFHGGAYVVFNRRLNPNLTMLALEGTRVSVIGGSAAADVVLRREVERIASESQTQGDPDAAVREARTIVANEFDSIHDVERAHRMGSVDGVITASELRPAVIGAIRRSAGASAQAPIATARR
ncbi:MAG: carboxyl transferase domain-containing protein [Microthrixaceae bacterium]